MGLTIEQKRLRKTGITATDAAAIVGFGQEDYDSYRSPYDVYLEKVAQLVGEDDRVGEDTRELAETVEIKLIEMLGREYGIDVERCTKTFVHPSMPWVMASPDGLIQEHDDDLGFRRVGVAECKLVGGWNAKNWANMPPEQVQVQNLWQQIATETKRGYIVAGLGGTRARYYQYDYDAASASMLLDLCDQFWRKCVLARRPPTPDESEAAKRMVQGLFPKDDGTEREATSEEAQKVAQYVELSEQLSALEKQRDKIGNQIRLALEEHSALTLNGYACTYKAPSGGTVQWQKVVQTLKPSTEILEKFTTQASRRLLIKKVA